MFGTDVGFGLVRMLILVWYGCWFGTYVGLVRMLVFVWEDKEETQLYNLVTTSHMPMPGITNNWYM